MRLGSIIDSLFKLTYMFLFSTALRMHLSKNFNSSLSCLQLYIPHLHISLFLHLSTSLSFNKVVHLANLGLNVV